MDTKTQNFYNLICRRKSVRNYTDQDIEEEKLNRILEMARCAPSAANCQPWHFIVLKKEGREEFNRKVLSGFGFHNAPVILVACAEFDKAWERHQDGKNYAWVDVSIAVTEMVTAATAEGLGTCWVASFDPETVRELLNIPEKMDIVTLLTIGYPQTPLKKEDKNRKPLEDIIHYQKW